MQELEELSRSRRILRICDAAVALIGQERHCFLDEVCGDDPQLYSEVQAILQAVRDSRHFLTIDMNGRS